MEPREALVALNLIEHVGPVRVRQLLEHFGDAPAILRASRSQLLQVRGIGEDTAEAIASLGEDHRPGRRTETHRGFRLPHCDASRPRIPGVAAADLRPAYRALRQRPVERKRQERRRHGRLSHDHALRRSKSPASSPTNSPTWASRSSAAARAALIPPLIRARSPGRAAPSLSSAPASTSSPRRRTRSCSSRLRPAARSSLNSPLTAPPINNPSPSVTASSPA